MLTGGSLWRSLVVVGMATLVAAANSAAELASIPAGEYRPLFAKPKEPSQHIAAFRLDTTPVSNADFLRFVQAHPQWARERIARLYADENYLASWGAARDGHDELAPDTLQAPVVGVSWFAAHAYCAARAARLPTTAEWEFAAMADETRADARRDPDFQRRILDWYGTVTPAQFPAVGRDPPNMYGVHNLHGLVWEWTGDFNSVLSTGESRDDSTTDNQFFCGGGAAGAADPSEYASFMRYALRASLQARYTLGNMGFRCAE